jgi:ribose 5-phosphate isomerase A
MDKPLDEFEIKGKNWIPEPFKESSKNIAKHAVKQLISSHMVIGLGSGPMAEAIIIEIGNLKENVKSTLQCVPSSLQIKRAAIDGGLLIVDENRIPYIDIVFDGADQLDSQFNMIKGGGGALLREKILHSAAKTIIITAESYKYLKSFERSIPIEIHPFALSIVKEILNSEYKGNPQLRMLSEGYPYVTENGNFIFDTFFSSFENVKEKEKELKNIAGVLEVGLFTKHANVYYKAKENGEFETIATS